MSADDMLAAQLWPWPDPIIKRNAQGGIIFVNAAFLQLYGGQVTDWHGCAVDGWPAPTTSQAASRFETRMPMADGEHIFDWLEYVMADGGALAISRNVTALMSHTPPPEPVMAAPVYQEQAAHMHPVQHASAPMAAVLEAAPAAPEIYPEPQYEPPIHAEAHNIAPQIEETLPLETMMPAPTAEPDMAPEITAAEPERDFERRALPIEDDESLLGSNWRDAVIAKAVGAEEVPVTHEPAPAEQPMEEVAAIAAPESNLTAKPEVDDGIPRILLAEDNAINALLTRTLLEADGCFVEVVEDGSLAVDAVKSNHYDMILMDMRMPNMDGLEATRKIRSLSNEAKAIPIIALTANAFDDDRNACFDAGMNDFMTKPVSAEELQQMVQTWTKTPSAAAA